MSEGILDYEVAYGELREQYARLFNSFTGTLNRNVAQRRELRALRFQVDNLSKATGADGAQIIEDLRMKVARREEQLRVLLNSYHRSVGYKAPEIMESYLFGVVQSMEQLLEAWEEEDARAVDDLSKVSGQGP